MENRIAYGSRSPQLLSWKLHSHWISPYSLMKINEAHRKENVMRTNPQLGSAERFDQEKRF